MNYDRYNLRAGEGFRIFAEFLVITMVVSYLFYDALWLILPELILFPVYVSYRKRALIAGRRMQLRNEFVDWIVAAAAIMNGGISAEKAFVDSAEEIEKLYGRKSIILGEIQLLKVKMARTVSFSEALLDLGRRSGVEDIAEFSQVFIIAKENSGQMSNVIEETAKQFQEKKDTEAEIQTTLSGKKMEQRMMMVIPLCIVLYLKITAGEFMSVLYHNLFGQVVMSLCLGAYIAAYFYGEKILDIKV